MKNEKKFFGKNYIMVFTILVVLFLVSIFSSSAIAQIEHRWTFAHPNVRELQNRAMELFCDLVKVYSDGKMEIEFYPNGLLGDHDETFHAVQEGSIDMAALYPYTNLVPHGVLDGMCWSTQTFNQGAILYDQDDGMLAKVMGDAYKEVGMHLLFNVVDGVYGIGNNVRPIKTPEDFANLKWRVSGTLGYVKTFENLGKGTGMVLTTIPWGELYNALDRGVVDGCWSTWSSMVEERHMEVLKYYTALDLQFSVNYIVVNEEKWDSLPKELQEALNRAGEAAQIYSWETHRRTISEYKVQITESGTEIYYPTSEEIRLFREKSDIPAIWEELFSPVLEELYQDKDMPQTILDEILRVSESY
jgi:TRAP-type C4-dicarboxylate transport system substrate-binding protein